MNQRHPLQVLRIVEESYIATTFHKSGRTLPEVLRQHNCSASELKRLPQARAEMPWAAMAFDDINLALAYVHEQYDILRIEIDATGMKVVNPQTERDMLSEKEVNDLGALILEDPEQPDAFFAELTGLSIPSVRRVRAGDHKKLDERIKKRLKQMAGLEPPDEPEAPQETQQQEIEMPATEPQIEPRQFFTKPKWQTLNMTELLLLLRTKMQEQDIAELKVPAEGDIVATYYKKEVLKL